MGDAGDDPGALRDSLFQAGGETSGGALSQAILLGHTGLYGPAWLDVDHFYLKLVAATQVAANRMLWRDGVEPAEAITQLDLLLTLPSLTRPSPAFRFSALRACGECQRAGLAFATLTACRISNLQVRQSLSSKLLHSISELSMLIQFL